MDAAQQRTRAYCFLGHAAAAGTADQTTDCPISGRTTLAKVGLCCGSEIELPQTKPLADCDASP